MRSRSTQYATDPECWLLLVLAEYSAPLGQLIGDSRSLHLRWNIGDITGMNWSASAMRDAVSSVSERGLVSVVYYSVRAGVEVETVVLPGELRQLLAKECELDMYFCKLTTDGVRVWEEQFKPQWSNYFILREVKVSQSENVQHYELVCGSDAKRRRILASFNYFLPIDRQFGVQNLTNDVLSPWWATYWKQMERGVRSRFDVRTVLSWSDSEEAMRDVVWKVFDPWELTVE